MALVRVLSPYVARVIIANPLQVKAIAHAHVKTDKIDAGVLASLRAAGFLPKVWTPDPETERLRRLVARRNQLVRHRTRIKNEVHAILHAHLIPRCPHADLFNRRGRGWLSRQPLPADEKATTDRHLRELDRLADDLEVLDREVAQGAIGNPSIERLITITGVNVTVAAGLVAAIGDIRRFTSPQNRRLLVGRKRLTGKPVPTAPIKQVGMRAARDQMGVKDRVHLVLDPGAVPDELIPPRHEPAQTSVSGSGVHTSGRKPAARRLARTPASILSVLTCACAIAFTCKG